MRHRFYSIYKARGLLMIPPVLIAFFIKWHEIEVDWLIWSIGGIFFMLGILLRVWAQMHIHYRLKVPKKLTTTGPYAFTRNPIYIANTLIVCSLIILMELIWFVPIVFLWCILIYSLVIHYEEACLLRKYGEAYIKYMATVPRWIPKFSKFKCKDERPYIKESSLVWLWPSIKAEAHCMLWLLIPFIKEFLLY